MVSPGGMDVKEVHTARSNKEAKREMCFNPNLCRWNPNIVTPNGMGQFEYSGSLKKWIEIESEAKIREELKTGKIKLIPCGKCLSCRIQHAANWAARCEVETAFHENNWFITLTYDDNEVPVINKITKEEYRGLKDPIGYYKKGQTVERLTLRRKDMQDFMKRLRKQAHKNGLDEEGGIKVYMCGEYGDNTFRPHYHCIIYGLKFPEGDLVIESRKNGFCWYYSEWLRKIWGHCKEYPNKKVGIKITNVSYNTCNYVARYCVKKYNGCKKEDFKKALIEPEFQQASQKPAIGYQYWNDHREEIYSLDQMYLAGGKVLKPPRYYDKLEDKLNLYLENENIEEDVHAYNTEIWQKLKNDNTITDKEVLSKMHSQKMKELYEQRSLKASETLENKLAKTDLSMIKYFEASEAAYKNKHKIAKERGKIKD